MMNHLQQLLTSASEIITAADEGSISLEQIDVVLNTPQIVWPGGQMMVKEDKTLADDTPYGGGQVLGIDTEEMTVTFVAHRGWGPDGRTIYYIVTDATPSGPAGMMGVVNAPTSASLIANSAAVDLFQFRNGIAGSGPYGIPTRNCSRSTWGCKLFSQCGEYSWLDGRMKAKQQCLKQCQTSMHTEKPV